LIGISLALAIEIENPSRNLNRSNEPYAHSKSVSKMIPEEELDKEQQEGMVNMV
jgi:hypothetical protein